MLIKIVDGWELTRDPKTPWKVSANNRAAVSGSWERQDATITKTSIALHITDMAGTRYVPVSVVMAALDLLNKPFTEKE